MTELTIIKFWIFAKYFPKNLFKLFLFLNWFIHIMEEIMKLFYEIIKNFDLNIGNIIDHKYWFI